MRKDIYIVGAGGHGLSTFELIALSGSYNVCGFLDDTQEPGTRIIDEVNVIGSIDLYKNLDPKRDLIAIGLAGEKTLDLRTALIKKLTSAGFEIPTLVHGSVEIGRNVIIGAGVQLHPGVILRVNSKIGDFTTVNTGAIVEHGTSIGLNCSISPGVVICGNVEIENSVFLGANSTILPNLCVGESVVLGAGSVATKNLEDRKRYKGVPAVEILQD
jgi:acetyltransferase-like isoleucine patch superfamily enzyme